MKNLILLSLMTSMFFSLSLSQSSAEVTLIVGDGSGLPGSLENPVTVSLNAPNDEAMAVQVDVCDVDNYLSCTTCKTTERTTDFRCANNELSNGCCRIVLFSLSGDFIEEGTGPVFTINYDVLAGAPSGNCIELNPEGIEIADETELPLTDDLITESGQFCFSTSSSTIAPTTTPTTSLPETTTTTMQPPPSSTSSSSTTTTKSLLDALIVGDGSALPGSTGSPVVVTLDNPDEGIRGIQVDVCDVDDFLSCTTCDTTERTTDLSCANNELSNGCCRIILVSLSGDFIEEGTGPVFTINYDVLAGAPSGNCIELNLENIQIAAENSNPLEAKIIQGTFCFGPNSCVIKELYGDNSDEAYLLKKYRDTVLSRTPEGQAIISTYYQWSPAIVKALEGDEKFKGEIKEIIDGILSLIR